MKVGWFARDSRRRACLWLCIGMALAAVPARAQSAQEGEVVVSLSVGYNLMYK